MPCSGDRVTGHWTGSNLSHYKSSCYDNGQVQLWVTIYCHASVTDRFKPDSPFIDMWRTGSNSSHHLMPCYGDKQIQAWQVSWLVRWWPLANIETDLDAKSCRLLNTSVFKKKHKHLFAVFGLFSSPAIWATTVSISQLYIFYYVLSHTEM